jgi:acetyltransferase-like isoleucine patch superfamily enzyme
MSPLLEEDLPRNAEVGADCSLETHGNTFRRFFSEREPGLVIGPRTTVYTWTTFSVERDGYIEVGADCVLVGANFMCSERIVLGDRVVVSYNVAIADSDFHPHDREQRRLDSLANAPEAEDRTRPPIPSAPVVIEDDVQIGIGAMILKGVTIGAGARVEAGAVVTRSVPPGAVVEGNPAREVGT